MATVSLLDAFGLDVSGSLKPNAHLGKVFSQFLHFQNVPLDQVQFASGQANLTFLEPIALSVSGLALTLGAGLNGNLRLRSAKDHNLNAGDPFEAIQIGENEIYLCAELTFSLKTGVTVGPTTCAFGLAVAQGFRVAVQRRFYRSDAGSFPPFGVALAQVFHSFVVPQSQQDLQALDHDTVVVSNGTGQLRLSNSFGIAAPVKQLAATSPIAGQVLQVNTSAGFTAEFSLTLDGGFLSRIRKLQSGALEIAICQSHTGTLAVQVSAAAGIVASAGKFDLAEKFLAALSRNPVLELQEFRQALPGEDPAARDLQIETFQNTLNGAITTKIAASVTASLATVRSTSPMFVFQVSPDGISSAETARALVSALDGDFTPLTKTPLPPGATQSANVFTSSEVAKQKLIVNLLGLVNYVSIGNLARISEIKRNADGDITCMTDTADANRLQALLLNVSGSTKRLQSLLSEDFLIQATFKAVNLKVLPPDFSAKHTFIEVSKATGAPRMKELLDVCRALDLLTTAEESAWMQSRNDFGRTTFWLQTTYSESAIERTFLTDNGKARTEPEFVMLGRQALGRLIAGNQGQEFRKLIADVGPHGNSIWQAMDESSNRADFNSIFGLPLEPKDPRVEAAGADYSCIKAWASAMKSLADAIVETRAAIAGSLNADDDRLAALRQQLRDRMANVVKHSGEQFGQPLGLLTVFLASGRSAGARVIVTGPSTQPLNKTAAPGTLASSVKA